MWEKSKGVEFTRDTTVRDLIYSLNGVNSGAEECGRNVAVRCLFRMSFCITSQIMYCQVDFGAGNTLVSVK